MRTGRRDGQRMIRTRLLVVGLALTALTLAACTSVTTTDAEPAPAEPDPLMFNLSIHVEGYQTEDDNTPEGQMQFEAHLAALTALADAADGGDGVDEGDASLTFELSPDFVRATTTWGSDFIPAMDARGHAIGVHADLGGTGLVDTSVFTLELVAMREAIEAQGVDVVHVSGICSPSEWVEAAIAAEFAASTGLVEFCLSSYPDSFPLPCGDRASECHGAAVTDWEHKIHPWHTSSSADWLTDDPARDLLLVAGESGTAFACLGETAAGIDCNTETDPTDVEALRTIIQDYVDHRESGRTNVLSMAWSIGRPPTAGFADELFAMVAGFAADDVQWSTMPEIVAAAG
jgi:hypothetical protein